MNRDRQRGQRLAVFMTVLMMAASLACFTGCQKAKDTEGTVLNENPITVDYDMYMDYRKNQSERENEGGMSVKEVPECSCPEPDQQACDHGIYHDEDFPCGHYGRNPEETRLMCTRMDGNCPVFEVEDGDDIVMTHYAVGDFDSDGADEYMLFGEQPTLNTYFMIDDDGTSLSYVTRDEFEEPEFMATGAFFLRRGDWFGFTNTVLLDENSYAGESVCHEIGCKEYYGYPMWFYEDEDGCFLMKGTHQVTYDQLQMSDAARDRYSEQLFEAPTVDVQFNEF